MDSFFIFITNYGNPLLGSTAIGLIILDLKRGFYNTYRELGLYPKFLPWNVKVPKDFVRIAIKDGTLLFSAVLLRTIIVNLIRNYFPKQRPFEVGDAIPLVLENPGGSFPSGHASMAFVLASFIFWKNRPLGIVSFVLASLVAYSRVYLQVHYWVDILAGAIIGIASFLVVCKLLFYKSHFR